MSEATKREIPPHVERMCKEEKEIRDFADLTRKRRDDLTNFIEGGSPIYQSLPTEEKQRMMDQKAAMEQVVVSIQMYKDILNERIEKSM